MKYLAAMTAGLGLCVSAPAPAAGNDEAAASALFDRIVARPARLRVFLQAMPKGGDLHNHLWGQPYAEQFLAWGAEAGLCASRKTLSITPAPCKEPDTEPLQGLGRRDEKLYSLMVESLSTRGRNQGLGVNDTTGHDDFFDTFGRFLPAALAAPGPMLASALTSAATNNVSYVELMENPAAAGKAGDLAKAGPWTPGDYEAAYQRIAPALPALVAEAMTETDALERSAWGELKCRASPTPAACAVTVRYQSYGLRSQEPAYVFGQLALGFALAEKDPRYVAVNIVAPEDGPVAVEDFDQHMAMFRFLSAHHPGVKKSIHAGELDLGLVPPAALRYHIRASVEVAGANRIGHGVDIGYETDAPSLLARMAKDRVAVEINLTSNDTILGVKGARHPLALYRAAGVPVMLSTDDEGVSRSDMSNEYLRGATEQGLRYADLKTMARNSLEYAFLPGASLWADGRMGERVVDCRDIDSAACGALIAGSEKAKAQLRLEHEFTAFERNIIRATF
ncbi:MAG: adenosine deaminase [Sphingobium sp.]